MAFNDTMQELSFFSDFELQKRFHANWKPSLSVCSKNINQSDYTFLPQKNNTLDSTAAIARIYKVQ